MAEPKKPTRRRGGLGRGIESLIPSTQREERIVESVKPMDVFFPPRQGEESVQRGGSARDLLSPGMSRAGRGGSGSSEGKRSGKGTRRSKDKEDRAGKNKKNQSEKKQVDSFSSESAASTVTAGSEVNASSALSTSKGKVAQKSVGVDKSGLDTNVSRETISKNRSEGKSESQRQSVDVSQKNGEAGSTSQSSEQANTKVIDQASLEEKKRNDAQIATSDVISQPGDSLPGSSASSFITGDENNSNGDSLSSRRDNSLADGTGVSSTTDPIAVPTNTTERNMESTEAKLSTVSTDEQKNKDSVSASIGVRGSTKNADVDTDALAGEDGSSSATEDVANNDKEEIVSRETIGETTETNGTDEEESLTVVPGTTFGMLNPKWIIPNSRQPRQVFSESELQELSESIAEVGLLQPIVVRPIDFNDRANWHEMLEQYVNDNPEARYELIMGERRWRASQKVELTEIPAIVRRTDDDDLLRDALMENLHRVQLNPIEEASAYQQLLNDFNCTQEILSERVKRSRSQIANTLRLLKLPPTVQRQVAAGVLSAGHARALLSVSERNTMEKLAKRIIQEGLSVRTVEEIVKQINGKAETKQRAKRSTSRISPENASVARAVADRLDTEVTVVEGKGKSRLVITFADTADLARIAEIIGINPQ